MESIAERESVKGAASDNPWFGRLFVSFDRDRDLAAARQPGVWHPPTDVYETDEDITIKVELAGVDEDDFAIQLDGRVLTISGQREDPRTKLAFQQMEISYGAFHSAVYLPHEVDPGNARAHYENGFLYIQLPKAQVRKVPITTTNEDE